MHLQPTAGDLLDLPQGFLARVALWHGSTYAEFGSMTNATKKPEAVKRANDLLLEHGHDMRNYYGDWANMTNDERRNMIEARKILLGKIGCNVSDKRRTVINVVIGKLRQVQDSLK